MLHFFRASISPKKQKKANWRSQLHAQRSKIHSNPLGHSEKIPFVENYKEFAICAILREKTPFGAIFIEYGDTKKCCTFSGLELVPPKRKKLIGALSCMHKGPKCIQTLWDNQKKIPFVENYKDCAICAILRRKTPFWGIPRG